MADRPEQRRRSASSSTSEAARDRRNAVLRGIARTGRLPDAADLEHLAPETRSAAGKTVEAILAVEGKSGRRLTTHRRALLLAAFLIDPGLDLDVEELAAVLAEIPDFD